MSSPEFDWDAAMAQERQAQASRASVARASVESNGLFVSDRSDPLNVEVADEQGSVWSDEQEDTGISGSIDASGLWTNSQERRARGRSDEEEESDSVLAVLKKSR